MRVKHRNWKALGSIAKTLCTGAFVAGYAIADKVVPDFKVNAKGFIIGITLTLLLGVAANFSGMVDDADFFPF